MERRSGLIYCHLSDIRPETEQYGGRCIGESSPTVDMDIMMDILYRLIFCSFRVLVL